MTALSESLNLLIIEDDTLVAKMQYRTLSRHWKTVKIVDRADVGLSLIRSGKYDLVLSDWDCPGGGGKLIVTNSTIPTVIFTGNPHIGRKYPASRVISKCTDMEMVTLTLLIEWIKDRNTRSSLS